MEFKEYEIIGVYHVDTYEKKESHQRKIGRVCSKIFVEIDCSMIIHFDKYQVTMTSEVQDWFNFYNELWVMTKNSVYRFKKIGG